MLRNNFATTPITTTTLKSLVTQYTDFRLLPEFPFLDLASAPFNYSGKVYMYVYLLAE